MSDCDEDFRERFLQANANKEYICAEFTEVLRNLIRAVAASSDSHSSVYRAVKQMHYVMELVERCDGGITYKDLFSTAVADLRDFEPDNDIESQVVAAANVGMTFVLEKTACDGFANARASKRKSEFYDELRWIEEAREEARKRWQRNSKRK